MLWRIRYSDDADDSTLNHGLRRSCDHAINDCWFRIRKNYPQSTIVSLRFNVQLIDDDELQVIVDVTTD